VVTAARTPFLETRDISRNFKGVTALQGVSFTVSLGEVVAVVGSNGAGKSTLMKILSGADQPSGGSIVIEGSPARMRSPLDARRAGIETLYQDLSLIDTLDAAGNIFLGRERGRPWALGALLDTPVMREQARTLLVELNPTVPLDRPVSSMSGGQRQAISLARAIHFGAKLVILDEPTAALGVAETALTLEAIRRFRAGGHCVILVSHDLVDVFDVADRILVLRAGKLVGSRMTSQTTSEEIIHMMTVGTGRETP